MGHDVARQQRRIDMPILDLDRVAAIITDRRRQWASEHGLVADPVTWMDADADWPRPLLTDRSQVISPMSVGIVIHGDVGEAQIVVYAGSWADADYARLDIDDPMVSEYVELDDADSVRTLRDRVIKHLARRGTDDG
jgi:hypothetical protein